MFQYQGGKRLEVKEIIKYEPDNFAIMIDAFGGGASVFKHYLKSDKKYKVIYNDKFKVPYKIMKILSSGEDETQKLINICDSIRPQTNEELKALYKKYQVDELPEQYLTLVGCAMRGIISAVVLKKRKHIIDGKPVYVNETVETKHILKNCELFKNKDSEILNLDYKELIEQYKNNPDVFIYCDPPYLSRKTNNEPYGVVESGYIEYIALCLNNPDYKCKIMVNCDFTGHTYMILKKNIVWVYPKNYALRYTKQIDQAYHLIATNYHNNSDA